ncbi:aryl-hydrocarbon-interacting protein-like 1 [Polypterus senegalus]|uniref:aryl-hydrocarbon-interacting protein-like 1 n=1 Tax=Polypterus senegalus TaxID=55291 RepID=UPI00196693E3|nr:aryl-hydrocarbon-interacting protein-like 1 [Polypterus senegalus]
MEEVYLLKTKGVKKTILHGGYGSIPKFVHGTKLNFHFQTLKCDFERTVIDDSRKGRFPMEIIVGKMFKMEVWEILLTSMRTGEVAEFWCDSIHTGMYPLVSKGLRKIAEGKDPLEGQRHTCGLGNMFDYHTTGYDDLDDLMKEPQALIFIMELIQVSDPFSYKMDSWAMNTNEKLQIVPVLHREGNELVKLKRYRDASEKYREAVICLRNIQAKVKPKEGDWVRLENLLTPLVLNYCQCMLELEEYYEVLEHTTELLLKHPGNVKAYYKRGKAHTALWNEKEARQDFLTVLNLDPTLAPVIYKELKLLGERMKVKYYEEKQAYWGFLQTHKEQKKNEHSKEEVKENDSKKEEDKEKEENTNNEISQENVILVKGDEKHEEDGSLRSKNVSEHHKEEFCENEVLEKNTTDPDTRKLPTFKADKFASMAAEKSKEEMLRLTPVLHNEGNYLFKEKNYSEASEKYWEAIVYLRYIQARENPEDDDWVSLENLLIPLILNYCQCMLELEEHYEVLQHTSELLNKHPDNVKAYYKRGKANAALCLEREARRDFHMVSKLDPTFVPGLRTELKHMGEMIRTKHSKEKKNYWSVMQEKKEKFYNSIKSEEEIMKKDKPSK